MQSTLSRLNSNIPLRVAVYYAGLGLLTYALWQWIPQTTTSFTPEPLRELFGSAAPALSGPVSRSQAIAAAATEPSGAMQVLTTAALAMISAFLLTLPVAWVFILTRQKKGFSQSVVQALVTLPIVVAGIVVLVKHSLALAFSLGAIVAAVKWRSTLEDNKDAVYVFLVTGIGLAAGVQVPVAVVLSVLFNAVVMLLWYTDFGSAPAALEGDMARRRLDRALATARTGTFVARLDEEVMKALSPDQLDALADRAWRRKRRMLAGKRKSRDMTDTGEKSAVITGEAQAIIDDIPMPSALLRVQTRDPAATRPLVDAMLGSYCSQWRFGGVVHEPDGTHWLEYPTTLAKTVAPQQVLYDVRKTGAPHVLKVELA